MARLIPGGSAVICGGRPNRAHLGLVSVLVTANAILQSAYGLPRAADSFDIALEGFADLVAAGKYDDAEALARETFRQWRIYEQRHPAFVHGYSL